MGGTTAGTAAPTTQEGNPGAGAWREDRGLQLNTTTCGGSPCPMSRLEVDEPHGRRLARVDEHGCPRCQRGKCRSKNEAHDGPRLEVLACDARIAVTHEVCYKAYALNRGL